MAALVPLGVAGKYCRKHHYTKKRLADYSKRTIMGTDEKITEETLRKEENGELRSFESISRQPSGVE